MTTLSDVNQLIVRLTSTLSQGGPTTADRDLADQYADLCVNINARLAQCSRMIDEGSSMQALMLAEEQPNLLDSVAAVSFAKSLEWQEACALNALRQAPKIDRGAVHKLNDIYTKGNRSDQTKALYKAFRAAMASRNDAEALDSIRAISRLDPSDSNAAKELARLEKKRREDSVKALKAALADNDEQLALAWLEQCEKLQVSDAAEVASARAVRERVKAREAKREIEQILPTLRPLKEQGRWQQCGERAARVSSLATTYRLEMSAADAAELAEAVAYFQSCRQEAIRNAQFKEAIAAIGECADQIQGVPQSGSKQTLDTLEEQRLRIRKAYEKAKEFAMPIPENLVERVTRIAANLDSEIERKRKARKMRNLGLAASLTLLLVAAVTGGYYFIRASQFANEALALKDGAKALPLRKLVEQLRSEYSLYTSVPSLKSALLESEAWLQGVAAQEDAAAASIDRAVKLAASDFVDHTPEQASSVFQQANDALSKLPGDVANTLRPKLAEPQSELAIWMGAMRDERVVAARDRIEQARRQVQDVTSADNAEDLRQALQPLTEQVRALLGTVDTPVQDMHLPQAMKAEIADLAEKVEKATAALGTYDAAMQDISSAANIDEYVSGLSKLAETPLPRSPMVKAAQQMAAKNLRGHELLGSLILPNSPEVWSAIKAPADLDAKLWPDGTRDAEIDRLRKLINNDNLVGIYTVKIKKTVAESGASRLRTVFARGKLERSQHADYSETARGVVYDPTLSGSRLNFGEKIFACTKTPSTGAEYGERIADGSDAETLTEASRAVEDLNLQQLVNSSGTKYEKSILELLDNVKKSPAMPALVKAYIFQELLKVANIRPNAWGVAWCPSLQSDSEQLNEIAGGSVDSGDWMIPAKANLNGPLSALFSANQPTAYMAEQTLNRELAKAAMEAGIKVYGYVGENGEMVGTQQGELDGVDALWGLDSGSNVPKVLFLREKNTPGTSFVSVSKGAVLSPLFACPVDKSQAVAAGLQSAGIPDKSAGAYQSNLAPLFRSPGSPASSQ